MNRMKWQQLYNPLLPFLSKQPKWSRSRKMTPLALQLSTCLPEQWINWRPIIIMVTVSVTSKILYRDRIVCFLLISFLSFQSRTTVKNTMHLKSATFASMCSSSPAERLGFCFLPCKGVEKQWQRGACGAAGLDTHMYRRLSPFHVLNIRDYFNSLFWPIVLVYNPWHRIPSSLSKVVLVLLFLQKLAKKVLFGKC